ncbi:LOW QUALITY PROTEIN: disease resistance protein RRS1 [Arabidopsis lyrata subsp. lyrata]|uniref:LOW QUALITY PROTEIN: disease resistance protein RRS1 n=1 Tax=Arabidopsis lyrata subsp. lyrata TaxID=81972 RepID=UPI000A29BDD4|nr:LOW QUALITY PROTEIN: disease resistance protein RRS1 [Arabidopsis lyrata subsp. lyrata]|eukprot:XP_020886809.1 LOW QUALITY PROTEIN: disease resistance protein RRS1 [Arabidopsis lyrata subsp. lyrata]
MDKLVTLMEYQKENGVLIIPIFFKVTPSEVQDPKGFTKETFSQLDNSVQAGRVQKWREVIDELAHNDECKWIAGNDSILPEEIVRYACLETLRHANDWDLGYAWHRNRQVLVQCKVNGLYEMQKLSEYESSETFSLSLPGRYDSMLNSELVRYASGIPLVLGVLGSFATNQCKFSEKEQLQMLRQNPPTEILEAFRRSFDGLNDNEKNMFLDLACFFRGENRNHVIQILDGCGYFTDLGIYGLIDESLIDPLENKIEMSNVFQDMGRFVVCEESKEPGKRSRLWDANEIANVLTSNSGTEAVEGIFLDMSDLTCELSPTIFDRTYRLRLLKLHCAISENRGTICLPRGLYSLPDELRLLHWESYPLRSLPRSFNPKNLVELNMPNSKMEKLWKGTKNLEKLKKIILSHSRQLIKIPRLSKALNLEHIDLEGCTSLVKVSSSIHHLDKLVFLNLKDCSRLRTLPVMIHLESLEVLNLSGCSDLKEIQDFSPNLKELYLAGTAIRELPSSIEKLTRLVTLDLDNCNQLQKLPQGMSNLKAMVTLKLSGCSNLKSLPNLDAIYLRGTQHLNTEITMEVPKSLVHHSSIHQSRLDHCETLDKLIPDLCLKNAAIQKSLAASVYRQIAGIRQENWQWSTIKLQPLSIFHFLASRLYALVSLCLSNACLVDLPKEICGLPSVNILDLGGNGFSKIPESIKLLPKLHSLRLRHCKNLKSLPELPQSLVLLNVHGCVSMKSVPWSFERLQCTFSNCFNLSPEVIRRFLAKALGIVKNMNREKHQKLITVTAFSICAPASVGLKSSTDVLASEGLKSSMQNGSFVVIHLTSSLRKTFLGFAMSVVVSFRDNYYNAAGFSIRCTCIRKMKNGLSHRLERVFQFWAPKEASKIKKDHIFVFYDTIIPSYAREGNNVYNIFDELVGFEFYPVNNQNEVLADSCEVKNCGVYVVTDASVDTSLVKKRFSPTNRERIGKRPLASAMDPRGFSSYREPLPRFKRGRYRRSVETAILKIRKRKREEGFYVSNQRCESETFLISNLTLFLLKK